MEPGANPCFAARERTAPTSWAPPGRSHKTCSARVGHTPVQQWTCAASLNFSSIVAAAAGWRNLPNRVPVLVKPQEGSSMRKASSALQRESPWLLVIKHLLKHTEHAIALL